MLTQVAHLPGVTAVNNPYTATSSEHINPAVNTAYATVTLTPDTDIDPIVSAAPSVGSDTLQVQVGGAAFTEQPAPSHGTEGIGMIAALIILFLLFRSWRAAVLPLLTGLVGVGSSLLAVLLISHVLDLSSSNITMGSLIGLGVGIDYARFIVNLSARQPRPVYRCRRRSPKRPTPPVERSSSPAPPSSWLSGCSW